MGFDVEALSYPPRPSGCLLNNIPSRATFKQSQLVEGAPGNWFVPALIMPFLLLVFLAGWGNIFKSGDAAAYIVGAAMVAVTENIYQQKNENFQLVRKRWNLTRQAVRDNKVYFALRALGGSNAWGPLVQRNLFFIAIISWNMYYVIHDHRTDDPTVDWVQIVLFFATIGPLAAMRFAGTADESAVVYLNGQSQWSDSLRGKVFEIHAKADRYVETAVYAQNRFIQTFDSKEADITVDGKKYIVFTLLWQAAALYDKIDDPCCSELVRHRVSDDVVNSIGEVARAGGPVYDLRQHLSPPYRSHFGRQEKR